MTWKDKTCERCAFRVGIECRRFPPSNFCVVDGIESSYMDSDYRLVFYHEDQYYPACAEYSELIEPPKATEAT